jgi:DNA-binding response OmpR family regulator
MGRGADRARRVVLVEDESAIATSVAARLRAEGYQVDVAADGPGGVELCGRVQPDLVVLDLMLPGYDGIEVCRRIQKERPVPVLILTARDSETDLLVGLGVGADDYMTKPFSMRELVARVGALLRRVERSAERGRAPLRVGPVEIDSAGRRVTVSGNPVHLTPLEFDLLARLSSTPGLVLSRGQLLADVWGYGDGSGARTVDSHIASLRRKLGPGIVRTVHGVGYSVEDASE